MQLLARIVSALLFLLALSLGLLVAAENTDRVTVVMAGFMLPAKSVGFLLVTSFILGVVVGMAARFGFRRRARS